MSPTEKKLRQIERDIKSLSPAQLEDFRRWSFDADQWHRYFDKDAAAGRLDNVAEEALERSGRSKPP